jgi:hypothetical protein
MVVSERAYLDKSPAITRSLFLQHHHAYSEEDTPADPPPNRIKYSSLADRKSASLACASSWRINPCAVRESIFLFFRSHELATFAPRYRFLAAEEKHNVRADG